MRRGARSQAGLLSPPRTRHLIRPCCCTWRNASAQRLRRCQPATRSSRPSLKSSLIRLIRHHARYLQIFDDRGMFRPVVEVDVGVIAGDLGERPWRAGGGFVHLMAPSVTGALALWRQAIAVGSARPPLRLGFAEPPLPHFVGARKRKYRGSRPLKAWVSSPPRERGRGGSAKPRRRGGAPYAIDCISCAEDANLQGRCLAPQSNPAHQHQDQQHHQHDAGDP